jgi:nucleoside-diphosphate-sugar epimerase
MKITIIGGLGYVGAAFIPTSKKDEHDITIIDPNWFDIDLDLFQNASVISNDVRDLAILPHGDVLIYLAAISNDPMGREYADLTHEINTKEAVRVAELAKKTGYSKFIFASSCSVYGGSAGKPRIEEDKLDPLTDYAVSKIAAERQLKEIADHTMNVVCLRFATACGVTHNMRLDLALNDFVVTGMQTGNIKVLSDGTPWRPFIDVNDMAQVMLSFCEKDTHCDFDVFNVGSKAFTLQMKDLAQDVANILNCDFEVLGETNKDNRSYTVDFTKLEKFLNYELKFRNLESTVQDLTRFYNEHSNLHAGKYFSDFRNNPQFIRLAKLKLKHNDILNVRTPEL